MKLVCSICLPAMLVLILCAPARSQDWSRFEVFGGADYLNANACAIANAITATSSCSVPLPDGTNASFKQNAYGWHGSLAENKTSWFGGVMDFSGDYANRTVNLATKAAPDNVRFNAQAYPFLFGPRFYLGRGKLSLFGSPMIGGVHARANVAGGTAPVSETKWAMSLGGGADFQLKGRIYIRGQFDWIRSHFPETAADDYQNGYRASGGIVFKFGGPGG